MPIQNVVTIKMLMYFILPFMLTIACCINGDDDVGYQFLGRKPTRQEIGVRFRFVMVKLFASLSGGCLLAGVVGRVIMRMLIWLGKSQPLMGSLDAARDLAVLSILLGIVAAYLLIGVMQNFIRSVQGRQQRNIAEWEILQYNFKSYNKNRAALVGIIIWAILYYLIKSK